MRNDIKSAIQDAIQAELDWRVNYESEHQDAGDNYSHLPKEGSWDYSNGNDRLLAFIAENEINTSGLDIDCLSDLVLDNFKMESGHIFSGSTDGVFNVDSFPVGEIEAQIDYAQIKEITGYRLTAKRAKKLGFNHCSYDCLLAYESTDAVWLAVISASELQELIDDSAQD